MQKINDLKKIYFIRIISLDSILKGVQEAELNYIKTIYDNNSNEYFDFYDFCIYDSYYERIRIYNNNKIKYNELNNNGRLFVFINKEEANKFLYDLSNNIKKISNFNNLINF